MDDAKMKDAALKIYRFIYEKKRYIQELNDRVASLYDHIFGIINRVDESHYLEIISQERYNMFMEKIENVMNIYSSIPRPITFKNYKESNVSKVQSYIEFLESITYDLCCLCGSNSLVEVLEIIMGDIWMDFVTDFNYNLIQYYNLIFTPTSCLLIDENRSNNIPLDTILTKELTNFADNLIEKIQGAELCIPINNEILIISGYFKKDSMNISRLGGDLGLGYKNKMVRDAIYTIPVPDSFALNYLDGLSFRDFIINDKDSILYKIQDAYERLEDYKKQSLNNLVKEFISGDIAKQRDILTLFLLDDTDEKTSYLANFVYDLMSIETDYYRPYPSIDKIYKSMQWTIQKIFLNNFNNIKKFTDNINTPEIEEVPYEQKIRSLNVDDSIKLKMYDKLKEYKQNKDGSYKPQQYLDGILRIPFNQYKKEKILSFLQDFVDELKTYCKKYNTRLIEELNANVHDQKKLEHIEDGLNITEMLNEKKNPTDRDVEKFINASKIFISRYKRKSKKKNEEMRKIKLLQMKRLKKIGSPKKIAENNLLKMMNRDYMEESYESIDSFQCSSPESMDGSFIFDTSENISAKMKIKLHQKNNKYSILEKLVYGLSNFVLKWEKYNDDKIRYIKMVRDVLDNSVYGHKLAKQQLERIIGQWIQGKMDGAVLGLHGPPGTGKTTLAKKGLAKCLIDDNGESRPFAFLPLGGKDNGSFLDGHSYTYVGSQWGRIIGILMETKYMNPIIFIDELDKVSQTEHGREIISILTHLTDSTQNNEFTDKYFSGIKFDLSKALIIFSYNDRDCIDRVLMDRILEIEVKPLAKSEKIEITKTYLLPEILESVGYNIDDILIEHNDLIYLIEKYTWEAGVRKLKEKLYEIVREINLRRIMGKDIKLPYKITQDTIKDILSDNQAISFTKIPDKSYVGIMNGLYATSSGIGGIIIVEAFRTLSDRKLDLELTGHQGDIMKESVRCAKTVAWNLVPNEIKKQIKEEWEINGVFGLHVHCPEAGTPKDGPSAGGVMTLAILSQLTNIPIRNNVGMTGEIDLNGTIRAIGGLQSKLEGARSAGVELVLVPKDNEDDLKRIPDEIKKGDKFNVIMVTNIHEALPYVLCDNDLVFNK